jgi:hypothetical protein
MPVESSDLHPRRQRAERSIAPNLSLRSCTIAAQSDLTGRPAPLPFGSLVARLMLTTVLAGLAGLAVAQDAQPDIAARARSGAIEHLKKMQRLFPDRSLDVQAAPPVIPELEIDPDPSGAIGTFQPGGPTVTAKNAFFQNLGTNGRACGTCHVEADGSSISARHVRDRFEANPGDPLFRLVDGATCPSDDVSTPSAQQRAYSLLLAKGLIRIGLPMPGDGSEFQVIAVNDPYGCNTTAAMAGRLLFPKSCRSFSSGSMTRWARTRRESRSIRKHSISTATGAVCAEMTRRPSAGGRSPAGRICSTTQKSTSRELLV